VTEEPRWDEESRAWELAYTAYLDSLCECGVPRSVCMDQNKAWIVDFRIGYRCRALMQVQRQHEKTDAEVEKHGGQAFPQARKWSAVEYDGSLIDAGQDSQG
jgi:hypothetical protein